MVRCRFLLKFLLLGFGGLLFLFAVVWGAVPLANANGAILYGPTTSRPSRLPSTPPSRGVPFASSGAQIVSRSPCSGESRRDQGHHPLGWLELLVGAYEAQVSRLFLPVIGVSDPFGAGRKDIGLAVGQPKNGYGTILHTVDGTTWQRQGSVGEISTWSAAHRLPC